MQAIAASVSPSARSNTGSLVREDLPRIGTLPVTRVKIDDKGNLQVRAGNVTGPNGVHFSRVELQFEPDSAAHTIVAVRAGEQKETRFAGAARVDDADMKAVFALVDTLVARGYSAALKMKPAALDALCELQELGKHCGSIVVVEPALMRSLAQARFVYEQQHERLLDIRDTPMPTGPLTRQQARSHADAAKPYQRRLAHVERAHGHLRKIEAAVAAEEADFAALTAAANLRRNPAARVEEKALVGLADTINAAADAQARRRSPLQRFADAVIDDRSPAELAEARRRSPWGRLTGWVADTMRTLFG